MEVLTDQLAGNSNPPSGLKPLGGCSLEHSIIQSFTYAWNSNK